MPHPEDVRDVVIDLLSDVVGGMKPTQDQLVVIEDVLEVNQSDFLQRGRGKTTARLMAALALLEDDS